MKKVILGGVAAAALVAFVPALAQVAPADAPAGPKVQARADVTARVQQHFARVDADRDGVITQAEVQALQSRLAKRMAGRADGARRRGDPAQRFARLDANGDGQVTRAEFDARAAQRMQRVPAAGQQAPARARMGERLFARLDANRDGAISRAEFDAGAQARTQRAGRGDGEWMKMRAARAGQRVGRFGGHMFAMADANQDSRVTLQEATAAALRHFDMADANRDGLVTGEERRQMRQQMHRNHQPRG